MSGVYRIGTADTFTGQYRDPKTLVESMLGRLKVEARKQGWRGTSLFDADLSRERGKPDMYFVAIAPGAGDVSVAEIRTMIVEKRKLRRPSA